MNKEKTIIFIGSFEYHEKLNFKTPAPAEIAGNIRQYCNELKYRLNNQIEDEYIKADTQLIVDGIRTDLTDPDAFASQAEQLADEMPRKKDCTFAKADTDTRFVVAADFRRFSSEEAALLENDFISRNSDILWLKFEQNGTIPKNYKD